MARNNTTKKKNLRMLYRRRWLKAVGWLEKLDRRDLDMNMVARSKTPNGPMIGECGSAACFMGWMPAIFPRSFVWLEVSKHSKGIDFNVRLKSGSVTIVNFKAMTGFFGITRGTAEWIFGNARPGYRTPRQVAAKVRELLERKAIPNDV